MNQDILIFYVPVPDMETGSSIAKALLKKKLIACANILPPHKALFMWDGEAKEESENLMIVKTRKEKAEVVEAEIKSLHPYECPCVLQIDSLSANTEFAQWVHEQT